MCLTGKRLYQFQNSEGTLAQGNTVLNTRLHAFFGNCPNAFFQIDFRPCCLQYLTCP